jgi:hypothetical protein
MNHKDAEPNSTYNQETGEYEYKGFTPNLIDAKILVISTFVGVLASIALWAALSGWF